MSRLSCFFLALFFTLFLPVAGIAGLDDSIKVEMPESVGVGQPFLVRIFSPQELDDLEIFWLGRSVRPAIAREAGVSSAIALLGVGLKIEPGVHQLEVKAGINSKEHRFRKVIQVVPHEYQRETLSVEPAMIHPPQSVMVRIEREREIALSGLP
ncbi:MAG: hypothetical protein JEZ12_28845 [Desulfobacterium sp.]|nr:hypothetical protein [Desulfobacterium sp.]